MRRAEFQGIEAPATTVGMAEAVVDDDSRGGFKGIAAVLWLPDPEMRRGWREYYVRKDPIQKPNARPMGLGKPR